jgi:hypothetical protein
MNWEKMWSRFNRIQKSVMTSDSMTTKEEFFAESEGERLKFYNWMMNQTR